MYNHRVRFLILDPFSVIEENRVALGKKRMRQLL